MEREKGETIRQKLDEEFSSLRNLLYAVPAATAAGDGLSEQDTPAQPAASNPPEPSIPKTPEDELLLASQDLDYDQHVRELAFDKRSKPKDRTKTEEELALEQKEALEQAERKRQRRMQGLDETESEISKKRKRGGDDLEDDFDEEAPGGLGAGLGEEASDGEISDDAISGGEGEEGSGEETSGDEEIDEEESIKESADEAEGEEGEQEELVATSISKKGKAKKTQASTLNQELPYTFPCPETHDEFLEIIEEIDDKDVPTVVQRIRTLHHTSLASENKYKLQVYHLHSIAFMID